MCNTHGHQSGCALLLADFSPHYSCLAPCVYIHSPKNLLRGEKERRSRLRYIFEIKGLNVIITAIHIVCERALKVFGDIFFILFLAIVFLLFPGEVGVVFFVTHQMLDAHL